MSQATATTRRMSESHEPITTNSSTISWNHLLRSEIQQTLIQGQGRWSRALMAIAWIHLASFSTCHFILRSLGRGADPFHVLVWFLEWVAILATMRKLVGKGWFWSPPAIHFIGRLWLTFLILSFSLSTLNALLGWPTLWFKAAWGTLSSFFFVILAWLVNPWFLLLAVQMYGTALLTARFIDWNNLIYGLSWWLALSLIAQSVRRIERAAQHQPSIES